MVGVLRFSQTIFAIVLTGLLFVTWTGERGPVRFVTSASARSIDELKGAAKDIEKKMKHEKNRLGDYRKKENETVQSLFDIDLSLNQVRRKLAKSRKRLDTLEIEIAESERKAEALSRQVDAVDDLAKQRLVSFYKLHCLGKMNVLATAGSITDFIRRKNALERIVDHDRRLLTGLSIRRTALDRLTRQLNEQKNEQQSLVHEQRQQTRLLSHQRKQRERLLAEIRKKKALTLAAVESLKAAAQALDSKIQAYYRQSEKPGPVTGSGSFQSLKGLLRMPVKGRIVSFFGPFKDPRYGVENFMSGIRIKAAKGAPVHSVWGGTVIFSDWFKGYGNMMIVDHGDHYYTLYAHAEELFKKTGDTVAAGEVIGTAGDTGSMGDSGVHFEIRHHGKPVDPLRWLKKG